MRVMCSRVAIPEARRNPVRLYVDEFESMASEAFEGLIAEGRRFKLSLVLSHQNLAQLPPKLRSVIRNNVGLQILFRCGFQDAEDLKKELPEGFTVDELVAMEPGEMLLMPRGSEPEHVQCALARAEIGTAEVMEYRCEVLRRLGTPLADVTSKLRHRKQTLSTAIGEGEEPWGLEDEPWN